MGPNFRGFRSLPSIRENFIRELGVLAVLSRDSGQHPRKFYPRIFIFGAIRENLVPRIFPAIWYYVHVCNTEVSKLSHQLVLKEFGSIQSLLVLHRKCDGIILKEKNCKLQVLILNNGGIWEKVVNLVFPA